MKSDLEINMISKACQRLKMGELLTYLLEKCRQTKSEECKDAFDLNAKVKKALSNMLLLFL